MIVLALLVGATARGDTPTLSEAGRDTLTPIESLASQAQLTTVFGASGSGSAESNTIENLSALATDTKLPVDVQLHAIAGLGQFPGQPAAHDQLAAILAQGSQSSRGSGVILLRAAIEAFGNLASLGHETPGDVDILLPFLDHASRDVRAATAHALSELCDTNANGPLHDRLAQEPAGSQVQLAITDALRVLDPSTGSCAI